MTKEVDALIGRITRKIVASIVWAIFVMILYQIQLAAIQGYVTGQFCLVGSCESNPQWLSFLLVSAAGGAFTAYLAVPVRKGFLYLRKYLKQFEIRRKI